MSRLPCFKNITSFKIIDFQLSEYLTVEKLMHFVESGKKIADTMLHLKTGWNKCDCRKNVHFSSELITAEVAIYFLTYQLELKRA